MKSSNLENILVAELSVREQHIDDNAPISSVEDSHSIASERISQGEKIEAVSEGHEKI